MRTEVWRQVDKFFQAAVEIDAAGRAAFLESVCGGDQILRSEIESLLTADSREWDLIDRPALESAAILLDYEQPRLTPGDNLAHYEIQRLIGKGGMGEVYLARDLILNRNIALKLLPSEYTQDEKRLRRFRREAETVSALNHPNIITIHELGSVDDQQFISTELIEGETLRRHISRGPISLADALDVAIQIASALGAAHRAGIVHRDIKPENIMLRPDGYVKVLDFGLAKLAEEPEPQSRPTSVERIDISSGLWLGTLKYMSPEQASGVTVDARSDIFSLGVVFYEMVTGHAPFDQKNHKQLIEAILKEDPPALGTFLGEVPVSVVSVVAKMLSKDRACRYQTAAELILHLKLLSEELSPDGDRLQLAYQRNAPLNAIPTLTGSLVPGKIFRSMVSQIGRLGSSVALLLVLALASAIGYASYKFLRTAATDVAPTGVLAEGGTWATKAPISSPRWQAEPAVVNDVLFIVGGWNVCSAFADLEQYDPVTDSWSNRAPMLTARGGHGVGVLEGKLYAIGGSVDCGVHISNVEAYDPATDTWSVKASLPSPRFGHVVTAVNGKLYAIGGSSKNGEYLSLNNEYDPASDSWKERAPMPTPRGAAAVAVVNGIIYVVGGGGYSGTLATVEAYDPVNDSWTPRQSMLTSRVSFAVSESGGLIYAFGGGGNRRQVERYDPATDTWATAGSMPTPGTHFHGATLSGSIYLVGGSDGTNYSSTVMAFTPASNSASEAFLCPTLQVTPKANMPTKRSNMTVGEIDGIIYVAGGFDDTSRYLTNNEAYYPAADVWTKKAPMPRPRETRGSNNAVVEGKLYVIGGNAEGRCSDLNEAYDPETDSWMTKTPMPTPRCHLAVIALDGLIYALGGTNTNGSIEYSTVEVYNPSNDTWTTATPMPTARQDLGALALNGVLYAVGGGNPALNPGGGLNIVEAYDPVAKTWSNRAPMRSARSGMAVGALDGMLIVVGGVTNEKAVEMVEGYDPRTGSWTTLTTLAVSRSLLTGLTTQNTLYVFGRSDAALTNGSITTIDAVSLKPCSDER